MRAVFAGRGERVNDRAGQEAIRIVREIEDRAPQEVCFNLSPSRLRRWREHNRICPAGVAAGLIV